MYIDKKLVTVLIPCYNVQKYLKKLFKSISKQENLEIVKFIFLDDASTDSTLIKIKNFKKANSHLDIEIIEQTVNSKIAEARNILIDHVNTLYFYFIDPDDYFAGKLVFKKFQEIIKTKKYDLITLKGKLKYQINDYDFIINRISIKSPLHNKIKPKKDHEINPAKYISKNTAQPWNIFIKTEFYKSLKISFLKNYSFEDFPIIYLMFLSAESAYFINYYSHVYCSRPKGTARNENLKNLKDIAININYLYEQLTKHEKLNLFIYKYEIENRFFRRILFSLVNKETYKSALNNLKETKQYFLAIYNTLKQWQIIERLDAKKYNRFINQGYKRFKKIIAIINNRN